MSLKHFWLAIPVLLYLWWARGVSGPAGALVPEEPRQSAPGSVILPEKEGFRITPLARYQIRARVLRTAFYWFDFGARLSPIDLAAGWGVMSDQAVLDRLWCSQGNRFLEWHSREAQFPVSFEEINSHSANMHLVPANAEILSALRFLRPGQVIRLAGYLIQADSANGGHWRSSLTRTDAGAGACELMWVERLERDAGS